MKKVCLIFLLIFGLYQHDLYAQARLDSLRDQLSYSMAEGKKAKLLHEIALLLGTDSLDKSIEMETRALLFADPEVQKSLIMEIYSNLGFLYYKKNNFQQSIFSYNNGLAVATDIGNTSKSVKLLNNLGVIHQILGMYEQALNYLFQSLKLKEQLSDTLGKAKTLNNISVIYKNLGRYEEAFNFTRQALATYELLDRRAELADVYNNLGTVYEGLGLNDSALMYYYKSLIIKTEIKNFPGLANSYNNIGAVYLSRRMYDSAYRNFLQAYRIRLDENDSFGLVRSLNNIGRYHLNRGSFDSALFYFNRSLAISQRFKMFENLQSTHANLARTFDSLRKLDSAYAHYKIFTLYKDTIRKKQIQDQLSNLAIHYETENLEKEKELIQEQYEIEERKRLINLYLLLIISFLLLSILVILFSRYKIKNKSNKKLSEKNDLISAKQNELQKALDRLHESEKKYRELNATKDKFFSIIAHDLKSPFNVITSFSEVLVNEWDEHTEEERKQYMIAVRDSSVNTQRLLENLLHWARAQIGAIRFEPESLRLKDLVEEVLKSSQINIRNKKIVIRNEVDASLHVWADVNMLQTILRNLISNAIKFSPSEGVIHIHAACHPDTCIISVKDNGTGMTKKEQKRLFDISEHMQKEGTQQEEGTGIGLILCKEFVDMHNGSIWVHSQVDEGSEFYVSLPVK